MRRRSRSSCIMPSRRCRACTTNFLAPWARKVEAESGGRIRIDIFPSMQLGGAPAQLFDQARDGAVDIVWAAPSLTPGRFPKIETFELPFLPSRRALVSSKALQDFAAIYLKDEFARGSSALFLLLRSRRACTPMRPVRTIEDIKDLKLHVQTRLRRRGDASARRACRCRCRARELPVAIAQHVVDGCVDPWHMVPPLRLNDVLKTHTEFSDLSLSSRDLRAGDEQGRLRPAAARSENRARRQFGSAGGRHGRRHVGSAGRARRRQCGRAAAMSSSRCCRRRSRIGARRPSRSLDTWLKEMKEHKVDGGKLIASAHALLAKYVKLAGAATAASAAPQQEAVTKPQPPRSAGETTRLRMRRCRRPTPRSQPRPPQSRHRVSCDAELRRRRTRACGGRARRSAKPGRAHAATVAGTADAASGRQHRRAPLP